MSMSDVESRRAIISDFSNTLFVEAGAGSGKTTSLVSRIVMLVIRGHADIREIVALTFTNEGAASLRSKIRQELEKANLQGSYDPRDGGPIDLKKAEKDRITNALSYLPLAQFCTIHSFCLTLLKERPIEAGIDPQVEMNTEGNVTSSFDDAWREFVLESSQKQHPFVRFAVEQGVDLEHVMQMAAIRCANPDLKLHVEHPGPPGVDLIELTFQQVTGFARELTERADELKADAKTRIGQERATFVTGLPDVLAQPGDSITKLQCLLSLNILDNWTKKQSDVARITGQMEALIAPVRKQYYDDLHSRIAGFIEAFHEFFGSYKKATSSLEFVDLLFVARTLLKENYEVREFFKSRFRYFMVDEAQDIDPLQTEIVFFLSEAKGGRGEDWRGVNLEPGKLFMVGDPKQSIYRFRRADIAMYEQAKDLIRVQGGRILTLDRNFRSAGAIIDFVNAHFSTSFGRFKTEISEHLQPEYTSIAVASLRDNPIVDRLFLIAAPDNGVSFTKANALPIELAKLVSLIKKFTSPGGPQIKGEVNGALRSVAFRDIMVLMKTFTNVAEYTRAFEEAGIPYNEIGGKTFFDTEDLRGLILALKAIDDPTDTISLFGALKSPVFGISDRDMFEWVSTGHSLNLYSREEGDERQLPRALALFRSLHYRREELQPSGVLRALFDATGVCHIAFGQPNGVQKASKLFRLLEMIHEIESVRSRSFRGVVGELEKVMESSDPRVASISITPAAADAVRITSIHKAKGLEAPVVFLADCTIRDRDLSRAQSTPEAYFRREGHEIVIPYGKGGFYSLDPDSLIADEQKREDCESERLRYVATTRAQDILVVCVPGDDAKQVTFNGQLSTSLRANRKVSLVETSAARKPSGMGKMKEGRRVAARTKPVSQFREAKDDRDKRFFNIQDHLRKLSPVFQSVHEAMEIDTALFKEPRRIKGTGFGRVVHRAMQHSVLEERFDASALLDQWMEEEGVSVNYRSELRATIEALRNQQVIVDARSSPERYCEWEYFFTREGIIQNGVIDLVYKTPAGGWVIVDYKTDDVSDPERKSKLDLLYASQLRFYASAFEEITGNMVVDMKVLYTSALLAGHG